MLTHIDPVLPSPVLFRWRRDYKKKHNATKIYDEVFNAVSLRLLYFICLVDNKHLKIKNNALVVNKGVLSFCMPNTDLLFLSMPNTDLVSFIFFPFLCLISITSLPKLSDQWSMKAVLGDLQNISPPVGVFAIQIRAGARRQRSSSGFGQQWQAVPVALWWCRYSPFFWGCTRGDGRDAASAPLLPAVVPPRCVVSVSLPQQPLEAPPPSVVISALWNEWVSAEAAQPGLGELGLLCGHDRDTAQLSLQGWLPSLVMNV